MKIILIAFAILIFPYASSAAPVDLRDLNSGDDELLRKSLPTLFQGEPEPSVLDEAIRVLMAGGKYENVFVERRADGKYDIVGKPVRTIEEIEIAGVRQIPESEIKGLLDMKPGDRFDRKKAVAAGERIKTYYGENGFFNAVIEVNFEKLPSKNMKVIFTAVEKEPCLIEALAFETPNADLRKLLVSRFGNFRRRRLTTDRARRLSRSISEFLVDKRYLSAELTGPEAVYNKEKTRAWLTYEIREPYRWEFYMSGYKFMTLADLYHALDLGNRERKNVDPVGEGAERLRRAYLEQGYASVQIDSRLKNPPDTYLNRVYYDIREGPRARLKTIEVQGRISRPSNYYESIIRANSSNLISRGWYNRQDLEVGEKNLVTDLRNQGFLKARVLSSRIEFNEKRDQVTVFVLLEEGPQTQIRGLDFEGNKFFSSFELAEVTGLETNAPLRLDTFEECIARLKDFYHNQGFLEMRLLNEREDLITYNDKGTQARIQFRIYEGPRVRIHTIAVEGNTITRPSVILKEADFTPGEVLTPAKIEDATARLNKLGLFSRVSIRTLEEGTNVAERTLVISVADRDPGIFRMGSGVTNERNFTVRGFGGISYGNIGGTGRGVSLRAEIKENVGQINYPEHQVTAGYFEPFLFDTRTRGRVFLTRSERVFDYQVHRRDEAVYKITQITTSNRVDLLTERDLTLHTKLTWKVWALESNTDSERNGRCVVNPRNPEEKWSPDWGKCPPDTMQVGTVGPTLDIDYRDSAFLPTRGSFTRLVVDYSDPSLGSSKIVKFARTEGNFTYYQPFKRLSWVWTNSVRGGYVVNLSDRPGSGVPTSYAFLLGGINTVRGYDLASPNERIPKDGNDGFSVKKGNQPLIDRSSTYYLFKSELRFPVYEDHGGVIFYDGGGVQVEGRHFYRPYRDAIGIGYRYNTPVGPFALDLAFKISPEKGEEKYRFHLSIGTF